MKIAYIISAYKDAKHLAKLVDKLDYDADFYIHIDRNVDIVPFMTLLKDKATFVSRHRVSWGGWQQVEYQRELLQAVIDSDVEYSHIVCLSGQDYPLWSNERIHRFFADNSDTEFISAINITQCDDRLQQRKIKNYHCFRDLNCSSQWLKNKFIVGSRCIFRFLHFFKPLQVKYDGRLVDVFMGSDYWAITPACARLVLNALNHEGPMIKYFKSSFTPSEMCLHTIICNSYFASKALIYKDKTYPGLKTLTPLHYIDYRGFVRIMTLDNLPELIESDKMFCRKIVSGESDSLVEAINKI